MESSIKKCPFCGEEAAVDTLNRVNGTPGAYRMQCLGCGATTRWCSNETVAKTAWGIRVPLPRNGKKRYKPWQQLVYLIINLFTAIGI